MEERREQDERVAARSGKGKDRRWNRRMEEDVCGGDAECRVEEEGDERGREKGRRRVKGLSVCERVGVSPDWARVSTFLRYGDEKGRTQRRGDREREREKAGRMRDANEKEKEEDKRDIGEKESLARERRDRVPGGQDRFELSKIYGRRFDLRARGVTPGSLGQGP